MRVLRLCLALAVIIAHSGPIFGWTFTRLTGGLLAVQMFYGSASSPTPCTSRTW
jgi:peptidoglycan/LPS O-acetylase OafA/YrhL